MCQHRIYEKLNYLPSSDTLVLQCLRCDMKIRVKMIRPQPEYQSSKPTVNPPKGDGATGKKGAAEDSASPGKEFAVTHKGRET